MRTGSKSPAGWKELYKLALLETDQTKVLARVAEAHAAISLQLDNLTSATGDEYAALKDAQKFLCLLEKEESRDRRPRLKL
jgi:hypothetical protein